VTVCSSMRTARVSFHTFQSFGLAMVTPDTEIILTCQEHLYCIHSIVFIVPFPEVIPATPHHASCRVQTEATRKVMVNGNVHLLV